MNIRLHLIILLATWLCLPAFAQEAELRQHYNDAEEEYNLGRIEQAIDLLNHDIGNFQGNLRQSGYRLLSLCHIAIDQEEQAAHYISLLLNEDPYFTPSSQDPMRFIDMVNSLKAGRTATITTASSQAENMSEVPVPTTLITEEMIHNSGARNLQEVLAAYVPGMHIVDSNDDINIAMRGIYSIGQEKILIMLNGHRMNSYATNIASPDFSVSMEKLKQIEVLRGPASSLYGGVALTAVVNLITKQGADVDGIHLKAGVGNYGQLRGDVLFGKRYYDLDVLIWGSLYRSKGEVRQLSEEELDQDIYVMPEESVTIGRIGNKPSYDFGVQVGWKDLRLLYNTHFSEVIAPFTMTTMARTYDHDRYKTFNGYSPSFATLSHHADLSYNRQFGKLFLKGNLTYDKSNLTHYQVLSDLPLYEIGEILGIYEDNPRFIFDKSGLFRNLTAQEQNYGIQLKGVYNYINDKDHKGSVAFGAEFSHFYLDDYHYMVGHDFNEVYPENPTIQEIGKGNENSADAFVQLKHRWHSLIFNAGLRYDYKKHTNSKTINELSPRVALILVKPKWNLKLSYSKSFVDAPYLYRKNNVILPMLLYGNEPTNDDKLLPETANSLQLTFAGQEWIKGLTFEVNGFYNETHDIILTQFLEYFNAGNNKTTGVELMALYRHPKFTADFNFTWTHTFKNLLSSTNIDANNNTPTFMSHTVLSWMPTTKLKLFSHIEFVGKQSSYNLDIVQTIQFIQLKRMYEDAIQQQRMEDAEEIEKLAMETFERVVFKKDMSTHLIFNVGAEYNLGRLTFGLNVRNLFNTQYYRSGMNTVLIPQRGRWFMVNMAYKI